MTLNKSGLMKGKRVYLKPVERLLVAEWAASSLKRIESCNKPIVTRILEKLDASITDDGQGICFDSATEDHKSD